MDTKNKRLADYAPELPNVILCVGDSIVCVNGWKIVDNPSLAFVVQTLQSGGDLHMKLIRRETHLPCVEEYKQPHETNPVCHPCL